MEKKVIVIGGGPGGYVAAIKAAQLGAKVTLIEKDRLGGTCLNRGCIPTKALYRNAEIINTINRTDEFGINVSKAFSLDIAKIQERKQSVIDTLVGGVESLLKGNKVEVLKGEAVFKDKNTVTVKDIEGNVQEVAGDAVIVATGSEPTIPPFEGAYLKGIYTSEDILNFDSVPETLTVVGGGVVGMELACIMNSMGSKVTVVEFLPNILAQVDTDITKRLVPALKKKGISINTSTKVTKIEKTESGYKLYAEDKKGEKIVESEKILISTGRRAVLNGLNLEGIGVEYTTKGVIVDDYYETNIKGVYAIGDVNGKSMLAHAASFQGEQVAKHIMGEKVHSEKPVVPGCIFIFPEVATVGITEDEAKKQGLKYRTSKFMFGANGKALTLGEGEGFIKLISSDGLTEDKNDDIIIGAHIMGPHASDLIHECTLAIDRKIRIGDIKEVIHAHPTLSEVFIEAVNGLVGEAIHIMPLKK